MNRLQLATLLSWAGDNGLKGRKRLQKIVYFLQEAGCPLDCRYTLHHFGPYSSDVADRCDEMVAAGLLDEKGGPSNGDPQYSYTLTPLAQKALAELSDAVMVMQPFQTRAMELIKADIWQLELGSTILFCYRQTHDWNVALDRACKFKKVSETSPPSLSALELAKKYATRA